MQEWKMKAYLHAIDDSISWLDGDFPKGTAEGMYYTPIGDPSFHYPDGSRLKVADSGLDLLMAFLGQTQIPVREKAAFDFMSRYTTVIGKLINPTCAPSICIPATTDFLRSNSPELEKLVHAFCGKTLATIKKNVDTYFTFNPADPGLHGADGYIVSIQLLKFSADKLMPKYALNGKKKTYPVSCLAIASTPDMLFSILDEAVLKAGAFFNPRSPGKDYPVSLTIERNGVLILNARVMPAKIKVVDPSSPEVWDFGRPVIDWESCEWRIADVGLLKKVMSRASTEAGKRYKDQCLSDALGL